MALTQVDQGLLGQYAQYTGFKNRIINGAMAINQRGVTSGVTSGYFVDRWQVSGVSTTSLISSSLPNNFTQAISINRTSAAGTMTAYQPIESKNCYDLVGQSVTLSFWAQNVTGLTSISANLSYANSADSFGAVTSISTTTLSSSPSSSWTYYTATFTSLPSGVANGLQVSISGATAGTGTLGITGVQLEKGSTATSFDYRPYGTELQLCQRYFEKSFDVGTAPADGVYTATSSGVNANSSAGLWFSYHFIPYKVPKRTSSATLTFYGSSGLWQYLNNGTWTAQTATSCPTGDGTGVNKENGFTLRVGTVGSQYQGVFVRGDWTSSAEL